jgi:DNA adenine methylase
MTICDTSRNGYTRICTECKQEFVASRRDALYCSPACRQRVNRRNKRNQSAVSTMAVPGEIRKPPIRYFGGKWRVAKWIIDQFPQHTTYVEPFAGGASVLFQKQPALYEVINDRNADVVNFFDVLRTKPDELIRQIKLTPFSRYELKRARLPARDPIERARRFYIRQWQSFGSGESKTPTGWRFQRDHARGARLVDEWDNVERLYQTASRLKAVQIECDDALKVINRFDTEETLFYVDPPYLFSTRANKRPMYAHEMNDNQHHDLLDKLLSVRGMVVLSGYKNDLYMDKLKGWRMLTKHTRTNANGKAIECLWVSPKAQGANNEEIQF